MSEFDHQFNLFSSQLQAEGTNIKAGDIGIAIGIHAIDELNSKY